MEFRKAGGAPAAVVQRFIHLHAARLPYRREAKQKARKKRETKGREQHLEVEGGLKRARPPWCREQGRNAVASPVREEQTSRACQKCKRQPLRKQLPDDSPASRAQGEAQADLALPDRGLRQKQVRHVRTGNQQNQRRERKYGKQQAIVTLR